MCKQVFNYCTQQIQVTFYLDLECNFVCGCLTGVMPFIAFLGIFHNELSLSPFGDDSGSLVLGDLYLIFSPHNNCTGSRHLTAQLKISFKGWWKSHGPSCLVQELSGFILKKHRYRAVSFKKHTKGTKWRSMLIMFAPVIDQIIFIWSLTTNPSTKHIISVSISVTFYNITCAP